MGKFNTTGVGPDRPGQPPFIGEIKESDAMKKMNSRKLLLIIIDFLTLILACFAAYFLSNSLTIVHLEPHHVY